MHFPPCVMCLFWALAADITRMYSSEEGSPVLRQSPVSSGVGGVGIRLLMRYHPYTLPARFHRVSDNTVTMINPIADASEFLESFASLERGGEDFIRNIVRKRVELQYWLVQLKEALQLVYLTQVRQK